MLSSDEMVKGLVRPAPTNGGGFETPTWLELVLTHNRPLTLVLPAAVTAAAWTWVTLLARDTYGHMQGPAAWMMTVVWDWPHLVLLWLMWAVMMTAMMLPTAAPLILLYGTAARRSGDRASSATRVYALAGGYLLVWTLFSVVATALQRGLAARLMLTPMMEPASSTAAAIILAVAGLYQLTPLKRACLRTCRSPLGFMMQRWRGSTSGAFRLGLEHGWYCLGCCWALMLILFAGGVMNLMVILALTVWVLVEKWAPAGERTATASGIGLLVVALWMATR
jgi:predicted metal-binding membrane protein